jgi:choline kinase
MVDRLLAATPENVLMFDEKIEDGDEPVKICFNGETIVDFRKVPANAYDRFGESVGFFRFAPDMAQKLATRCEAYVEEGKRKTEYEEAIRDMILLEPERFGIADISDLPWTEIDFEGDVIRARNEILPQLQS